MPLNGSAIQCLQNHLSLVLRNGGNSNISELGYHIPSPATNSEEDANIEFVHECYCFSYHNVFVIADFEV